MPIPKMIIEEPVIIREEPVTIRTISAPLNSELADGYPCSYCFKEIIVQRFDRRGKLFIDRDNRVDCEEEGKILSYHLECYDLEVFGYLTIRTQRELRKWKQKYDQ